jgi:hypothetical protein
MCSAADASLPPSQATAHGSRSMWIATPSSYRTRTDYSLPVSRRTAKDSGHYHLIDEPQWIVAVLGTGHSCICVPRLVVNVAPPDEAIANFLDNHCHFLDNHAFAKGHSVCPENAIRGT